jgi:hypothetical protein
MQAQANALLRQPDTVWTTQGGLTPPLSREPSETLEPSASSSATGRLYRGGDSSSGEQRDETAARLRALGVTAPLYKRFPCVLAEHDHCARVYFTTEGFWRYYCDHLARGIGLAEVRAAIAYGRTRELSGVEAARWRERLDFEAGLRIPVVLDVRLPESCPETVRVVAGAMRLFVGLRGGPFPLSEPFVFASEFAQAYCNLSAERVRPAKDWLERAGVIYRTGKHGRAILWKLAAQDKASGGTTRADRR